MNIIQAIALVSLLTGTPESDVVPPHITRVDPRRIIVSGADFAWITPGATIASGTPMMSPSMAWGHSIEFIVDPETDYRVSSGIRGHRTQTGEHTFAQGPTRFFVDDVSITQENTLDWIVYNRIHWLIRYQDFIAQTGVDSQQVIESVVRVQAMIHSDGVDQ